MKSSNISLLSFAERLTLLGYYGPKEKSVIVSETVGRVAGFVLLTPAAAIDLSFHSLSILPAFLYCLGKSVIKWKVDFYLPWQHLQRVRNAVSPLLLGSISSVLHPLAGIVVSEPTDKHIALGILSSNTKNNCETPCSPIHNLSIVGSLAHKYRKKEIFSAEHLKAINSAGDYERSLEFLQAHTFVQRISNVTLNVMAKIQISTNNSNLNGFNKALIIRASGLLIPLLAPVDAAIALAAQTFFAATGIIQALSGRGPIYTEITKNPLLHASLLLQTIIRSVGTLIAAPVWMVSPMAGLKVIVFSSNLVFNIQNKLQLLRIKVQMHFAKNDSRFVLPIVTGSEDSSVFSRPFESMHTTYLIVEKKEKAFNLYLVNRPDVYCKRQLNSKDAFKQIQDLIEQRFQAPNIETLVKSKKYEGLSVFSNPKKYLTINNQGNCNCVVSNLFGMLETLDKIQGIDPRVTRSRNQAVRALMLEKYSFYRDDCSPFADMSETFSLRSIWEDFKNYPDALFNSFQKGSRLGCAARRLPRDRGCRGGRTPDSA